MTRKMVAVAAAALGALMLSGTIDAADARKGGWSGGSRFHGSFHGGSKFHAFRGHKFHGGFHRSFKYGGFHSHKFHSHKFYGHKFRKRHYFVGVPLLYGAYAYGNGCYWLRKQALYTGSPYWWNRYYDCIYGYGYGYY
jgi:hypothetical protein